MIGKTGREVLDVSGKYIYMPELRRLNALRPPSVPELPAGIMTVATPLKLEAWEAELRCYPDREFAKFILDGIKEGFRIGFDYNSHTCSSAVKNMR